MADNQTPQAQYELPEGTGNNPQEDYNENFERSDHAGGWVTAEIAVGEGGSEGDWYTFNNSGLAKKAQADSLDNCAIVFMLTEDTLEGEEGTFLKAGNWYQTSWGLDPSKIYYLSQSSAGDWTTVQPASGLIIVLGRSDQDTETFHIAEGGGGGGGGLNDHATLTNLAWSVAGHTMDTVLDMLNNSIDNVDQLNLIPKNASVKTDIFTMVNAAYAPDPTNDFIGWQIDIEKTGGATTNAWDAYLLKHEFDHSDAVNTIGRVYGAYRDFNMSAAFGDGGVAFYGNWMRLYVDTADTNGNIWGDYKSIQIDGGGIVANIVYGNYTGLSMASVITQDQVGHWYQLTGTTSTIVQGDVIGHRMDLSYPGTNRITGDLFAYRADSDTPDTSLTSGNRYAFSVFNTGWDYAFYSDEDTVPSYLAGVLQVDNTIWSEGTTGATPTSGSGTRFMWIPSKRAFRAGEAYNTYWDDANIGTSSFCFGAYRNRAGGSYSFSAGYQTNAAGAYSIAMGYKVTANSTSSIVLGSDSSTNGASQCIAIGQSVVAGTGCLFAGNTITGYSYSTQIGRNIAGGTTYYGLFYGESIAGGGGTRYRGTGIGRWIQIPAVDNVFILGTGVDGSNRLTCSATQFLMAIGMNSNTASIILDGSSAGVGIPATVNIAGSLTVSGAAVFTGGFYASPVGSGINSEAYGQGASATGDNSLSVGYNVTSSGTQDVGIGNTIDLAGSNLAVAVGVSITGISSNTVAIGAQISGTVASTDSVLIGSSSSITGSVTNNVGIGYNFNIAGDEIVAIGADANVSASGSIAIGFGAISAFAESIAIGRGATSTQINELIFGGASYPIDYVNFITTSGHVTFQTLCSFQPTGTPTTSEVIGRASSASGAFACAFGVGAVASATGAVAIGQSPDAVGTGAIAIGNNAQATTNGISIGRNSTGNGNSEATVIGNGANADGQDSVVIGASATNGKFGVVIGASATSTNLHAVSIGLAATAGLDSVAIGRDADASFSESIALGRGATTSQANEMAVGSSGYEIDHLIFAVTGDYLSLHNNLALVDRNLYIGSNPSGFLDDYPNNMFRAEALSATINNSWRLFSMVVTQNGGTGNATDYHFVWDAQITMNSVGGQHGQVTGFNQSLFIQEGDFGDVSTSQEIRAAWFRTQFNEVTALKLWGSLYGVKNYINANDGEITEDIFGYHLEGEAVTGVTLGGTAYGHYMDLHTSWDWAIYVATDVASYFGGDVRIDGDLTFADDGQIKWTKYTANSVTLSVGSSSSAVADLQSDNDGNVYHVDEVAGTPGLTLIVDFTSVTGFNWVKILATYDGTATHALDLEVYNWTTASWDIFDAIQTGTSNTGTIFGNHDFFIPDDANYIGTGGSAGQVRIRFNHPMAGNASHDLDIDVVALYQ